MKTLILTLTLTLTAGMAYCQNFEGEMILKNSFTSKTPALTRERLEALIGNKQEYFIKDGDYKSLSNGGMITMQLFDKQSNRIYNKRPNSDTLYWLDASVNADNVTGYEIKKNAATILGYPCDALILTTKTGTTTLYYCDKFKLNGSDYKKHQFGNWAFFTAKAGALPLKTIIENAQFKIEMVVTEIKPMKLEASFFKVAAGVPVKMSTE
jgi:hypothetical protein